MSARNNLRPLPLRIVEEEEKFAAVNPQPEAQEPRQKFKSWDGFEETPGNQEQPIVEEEKQGGAEIMAVEILEGLKDDNINTP